MVHPRLVLTVAVASIWAYGAPLAAQPTASLSLQVIEGETGAPLAGAQVIIREFVQVSSDAQGWARLSHVTPGQHLISVRHPGYVPEDFLLHVTPGVIIRDVVKLARTPYELPTLTVESRQYSRALELRGFYQRRRSGAGTYYDREDLDRVAGRSSHLPSALRTLSGARLMPHVKGRGTVLTSGRITIPGGSGTCASQIILDGVVMRPDQPGGIVLEDLINLNDIEAIEWYRGPATTPPQYNLSGMTDSSAGCGTLIIWTR